MKSVWITSEESCVLLGVGRSTFYSLVGRGIIPAGERRDLRVMWRRADILAAVPRVNERRDGRAVRPLAEAAVESRTFDRAGA